MARYGGGYDRTRDYGSGDWSNPYRSSRGAPDHRDREANRPWVGGYRPGYQGGSGGIPMRTTPGGYGREYTRDPGRGAGRRYGGDYWWLGEHELRRQGRQNNDYDATYQRFDEEHHPRYSPVGGNYHAMGGSYRYRQPPRPLREETWFSDWTRWF